MEPEQNISLIEEGQDMQGYENSKPSCKFNQDHGDEENPFFRVTKREDGFLQEQEIIDACQSINTSPKKRKIDKDGFVTPATPDIPKSSCHYGQVKLMRGDGDINKEDEEYSLGEVAEQANGVLSEAGCIGVSAPSQNDQSVHPVENLIKDMSEETKNIYHQFSKVFRECEEYETACPERLDKLLTEAKALEENLNQQKQVLCNRLKGLSRTLQLL
ncbi:uncharacterized protein LOC110461191 isoform X1 [Mizuhopecten yessoensis]|uniref:Uncharacterized protein n=1 Tax=Mizuhopecten yessoensis TaxID=6573 RepID=A0A210Q0T8_MIZYE|nr:uncharacterized protein LOC110461191 isoform X1 [Mizuhopecten yessoensis]OWF42361.1 hypothetical protein KP79_PYT19447 [Mizuhopecten yessoensis]